MLYLDEWQAKLFICLSLILPLVQSDGLFEVDRIIRPTKLNLTKTNSNYLFCKQIQQADCLNGTSENSGDKIENDVIKRNRIEQNEAPLTTTSTLVINNALPLRWLLMKARKHQPEAEQWPFKSIMPSTSGHKLERRIGPLLLPLRLLLALLRILLLPLRILLAPLILLLQVVRLLLRLLDPLFYLELLLLALSVAANIARGILRLIFLLRRRRKQEKKDDRETKVITLFEEQDEPHHLKPVPIVLPPKKTKKKVGHKAKQPEEIHPRRSFEGNEKLFYQNNRNLMLLAELHNIANHLSHLNIMPFIESRYSFRDFHSSLDQLGASQMQLNRYQMLPFNALLPSIAGR